MNEKIYVAESYKNQSEKGTSYQFKVKRDQIEKLKGVGKRNEIALAIEPKDGAVQEKHPTHNVYFGDSAHKKREVQLYLEKDALLAAPTDDYGNIKMFAISSSSKKMNADMSSFSVALSDKKEDGAFQFVGRGYDEATKFGETRVVGTAYKNEFGYNGEDGKSYSVNLDVEKMPKLDVNEYGDARLGIVPYNVAVPTPDGEVKEETRYIVIETNSQRANIEATLSLHMRNPDSPAPEVAINPDTPEVAHGETRKAPSTLYDCNIHTIGDNNTYRLIMQDRNPDKIGRDCADLVVFEDKYTPEMKSLTPEERSAAKKAVETTYVGKGWTNDPAKIKLSAADLTQEGLSKAIENNHTTKVMAIVKRTPEVVQENHVQQVQAAIKACAPESEEKLKRLEGLAKWVENTWQAKQAPPQQISNVKFTDEQLAALQAGQPVKAEGLEFKSGALAGQKVDRWITWNNKTGKCLFYDKEPQPKQQPKLDTTTTKQQAPKKAPKKAQKGMTM